jgi:hypothetical protein
MVKKLPQEEDDDIEMDKDNLTFNDLLGDDDFDLG